MDAVSTDRAADRVEPTTAVGVRAALDEAARRGHLVVPVGAGVDMRRVPPAREFVLLSTRGLTGLEDYEPADLTFTARAGTLLSDVAEALAEHRQWLPFDPPRLPDRTVGGLAATASAGPLQAGYGAPRDHVLGATVVTGDGTTLELGGRVMKNVAGFDLLKLLVGSRGTLGVIVSVTMRVFPRPAAERVLVERGPAERIIDLGRGVATAPVMPASAVVHEADGSGEAALVVRLHGSEASVDAEAVALRRHLAAELPGIDDGGAGDHGPAGSFLERVRDAADAGVVVRGAGLPTALGATRRTLRAALPEAALVADVFSGRVRAAAEGDVDPGALVAARTELQEGGGGLIVARGPDDLRRTVGVYGTRPPDGGLFQALRARFDARGVLDGGEFAG